MYASAQDCIDRLGEAAVRLLGDVKGGDPPAWTLLGKALEDASEEIDSYVAARHELPLDPVPRLLVRLCVEMGVYRRAEGAGLRTDERRRRYDDAIRLLRDIQSGRASLGIADPDPPAPAEGPGVLFDPGAPRVMARGSLGRVL